MDSRLELLRITWEAACEGFPSGQSGDRLKTCDLLCPFASPAALKHKCDPPSEEFYEKLIAHCLSESANGPDVFTELLASETVQSTGCVHTALSVLFPATGLGLDPSPKPGNYSDAEGVVPELSDQPLPFVLVLAWYGLQMWELEAADLDKTMLPFVTTWTPFEDASNDVNPEQQHGLSGQDTDDELVRVSTPGSSSRIGSGSGYGGFTEDDIDSEFGVLSVVDGEFCDSWSVDDTDDSQFYH